MLDSELYRHRFIRTNNRDGKIVTEIYDDKWKLIDTVVEYDGQNWNKG